QLELNARKSNAQEDWFDLDVSILFDGGEPLGREELAALLRTEGRYADVRGRLVDVSVLREREELLRELLERKKSGLAALVALRDEIHAAFTDVRLPEEVEALRERLRGFAGITQVEPPPALAGTLREYQKRGLDFLEYLSEFRFGGILADDMGTGKAQPLHVRVLTPRGWRRFGDLNVGDAVMSANGSAARVTGVFPQGELPAFRVFFSDGSSTLCSDDHLWIVNSAVRKRRGNPYRVLPLKEVRQRLYDAAGNARHYIPIAEPFHFENGNALPVDPYLLGCLLGDGCLKFNTMKISSADSELIEECSTLLPTGTEMVFRHDYDYDIRRTRRSGTNVLTDMVRLLDLHGLGSGAKFVPPMYRTASVSERHAVLQGLLDTDGYVSADGSHIEFSSVSSQLAEDVAFLTRSLGGVARLRYRPYSRYTHRGEKRLGQESWRVTVSLPPQFAPFKLARKAQIYRAHTKYLPTRAIVAVEEVGTMPMQCIAVDSPDRSYITDDCIVTHNTIQAIAHIERRREKEVTSPSLVIAPTSVVHTLEHEIIRFAPHLRVLRLESGNERANRYEGIERYDIVITSYTLARIDAEKLASIHFRTIILDEAQNAKNPSSQISKVVRSLQATHRLALTGTPVENSLRDLWAIFAFLEPGLLGTSSSFRERFEAPIANGDERATSRLRARTEPFMLRRTKEDVTPELPERTESEILVDLSPAQRQLYRAIVETARHDILEGWDENAPQQRLHVLAALTRLRQVCAHPGLLSKNYVGDAEASTKFETLCETIEEILAGRHKVLVFSAFSSMLHLIRDELTRRGIAFNYLDGSVKDRD
ncbi:MAG: SNF2-related protein, partial [Vulcanimicrobiaceae bacterium]